MINEISNKLNKFLKDPHVFETEKDLVYFLVEVRKLLEILGIKQQYKVVTFYADWALHSKKEKNLDYIEHIIENLMQKETIDGEKFILMDELRSDISSMLRESGIELPDFTIEERKWTVFNYYLVKVLNDQPIIFPAARSSIIETIKFTNGEKTRLMYLDVKIKNRKTPFHIASGKYIRLLDVQS